MNQSRNLLRRLFDAMVEGRRVAAQRRVDAYIEALGLGTRDRR